MAQRRPKQLDVDAAVGASLRRLREERGWSQDELAGRLRLPTWTRVQVSRVENGERGVAAEELLAFAVVLAVPVFELLSAGEEYELSVGERTLPAASVRELLSGRVPKELQRGPTLDVFGPGGSSRLSLEEIEARRSAGMTPRAEAVTKAARQLGWTPVELEETAYGLWGHGLVAERDSRLAEQLQDDDAGSRRRQALRGHVTRQLLADLRAAREEQG